jgi:hypothetical protein
MPGVRRSAGVKTCSPDRHSDAAPGDFAVEGAIRNGICHSLRPVADVAATFVVGRSAILKTTLGKSILGEEHIMADTITSQIEAQGLQHAERDFERHQVEVANEATRLGRAENLVRHYPLYSALAGLGLGLGLGMLIRGLAGFRD